MNAPLANINPNFQDEEIVFEDGDLLLKTPFKLFISGQSGSGKSRICQKILSCELYDKKAEQVILCVPKNCGHLLSETFEDYRKAYPGIKIHEVML